MSPDPEPTVRTNRSPSDDPEGNTSAQVGLSFRGVVDGSVNMRLGSVVICLALLVVLVCSCQADSGSVTLVISR
ncbi:hypothetical protein ACWIG5_34515 [Streptomyces lydicus]